MNENQKISHKNILLYIWLPISFILTASDLINIVETINEDLIKWVSFFQLWFAWIADLRDFLVRPFSWLFKFLFNFELPTVVRFYIFLSGLVFSSFWIIFPAEKGSWIRQVLILTAISLTWPIWPLSILVGPENDFQAMISESITFMVVAPFILVVTLTLIFAILNFAIIHNVFWHILVVVIIIIVLLILKVRQFLFRTGEEK